VTFDDMINNLNKNFLKKLLGSKLPEFLDYYKYEIADKNSGNSPNDNYFLNYQTKYGLNVVIKKEMYYLFT